MLEMLEGRHDPICVLGSGKAQSKLASNKGLYSWEVHQVLLPYLRGPQLKPSRCVATTANYSNQYSVCHVHGVAPLNILPESENHVFASGFEALPFFPQLCRLFRGI